MRKSSLQVATLLFAIGACSGPAPADTAQSTGQMSGGASSAGAKPFAVQPVATFAQPWAMSFLPGRGNQALVTEKSGKLWLVDAGSGAKVAVSGAPKVSDEGQGGLLDVLAAPDFARSRAVYLTYVEPVTGGTGLVLARATLAGEGSALRLEGTRILWRDLAAGGKGGHFGGRLAFAPDGKSLFLTRGDRQRFSPAQDLNQPLGKILHLTLDGQPAPGNPFASRAGSATITVTDPPEDSEVAKRTAGRTVRWPGVNRTPSEIWTYGHRNPLGLAFAPDGRLWQHEMGPKGGDEVNLILAGKNYGYSTVSNGTNYNGVDIPDHKPGDGFEAPKVFWNPSISPAGLIVYSGNLFPQWKGDLLLGGLSSKALLRVDVNGDQATKAEQWDMGARIREVEQGPGGEVYLLEDGASGRLLRLTPAR